MYVFNCKFKSFCVQLKNFIPFYHASLYEEQSYAEHSTVIRVLSVCLNVPVLCYQVINAVWYHKKGTYFLTPDVDEIPLASTPMTVVPNIGGVGKSDL